MKNNASLIYRMILILGDFLVLTAAFSVSYVLRVKYDERPLLEQIPAETYLYAIILVLPLWIIVHSTIGLYTKAVIEYRFLELRKLILGSILGVLTVLGYDFIIEDTLFPARLVVVYGFLLGFSFLVVWRTFARMMRKILFSYNVGITNLLLVGGEKAVNSIIGQFVETANTGYRIIGVVGPPQKNYPDLPAFKDFEQAEANLKQKNLHGIIQAELYKDEEKNSEVLVYAQTNHLEYRFVPANSDLYRGNIEVELFREIPVVAVHQTALIGWGRVVKRIFDILLGSIFLALSSPLMLLAALAQKISTPNESILFSQKRLTQFNQPFTVYKFRTQLQEYDGTTPEKAFKIMGRPELTKKYRDNGDYLENDPRVTKIGKILRITSIDELPQLFNVVRGDISLVGPRALIPEELSEYQQKHHILSVKSGMTGLAQVSGRLNISFEERRKLDVYYVQNWTFWLDIVILLKTLRVVLGGHGAK